ncbi:Hypothetical predicted protein [Mytilus galloprovincialis]|uniref:DNA-directed DNA polymerase n=1 Tax=Mytilus galloprovincialis TaxID=29158 RepID=A0A8B6HKE9_MYTGA|nr:Hypothetical predicted protein [Mytilus galloprovincialis]
MRVPFTIYADFECFVEKIDTCQPNSSKSYTKQYQHHEPSGYCYYIKYEHKHYKSPVLYQGLNVAKTFVREMEKEMWKIYNIYKEKKDMVMTEEDKKRHETSMTCHICSKDLNGDMVRDHDHITDEKYISFSKKVGPIEMRFIDSCRFMPNSLDTLVKNLMKDQFKNTKEVFNNEHYELLLRKGVYPYEYMDSPEKLMATKLPFKEDFYSKLTGEDIDDDDYEYAKKIWKTFECKTMRDFHNLYLLN